MEGTDITAFDAASAAWSIKSILSNIQRTSFLLEILVLAITALVVILTIFLALKLLRTLFGFLKIIYEKISGKFGSENISINFSSIKSIPIKIFNFLREKITRRS
mgnify:FL=1